jgi:argininosuccinate synthase
MRDIEAFLESSQETVTGTVRVQLYKGSAKVLGADSPHSLFNASMATYGEENALWDGRDAQGFTRLAGIQSLLAAEATRGEPVLDPTVPAADGTPVGDGAPSV